MFPTSPNARGSLRAFTIHRQETDFLERTRIADGASAHAVQEALDTIKVALDAWTTRLKRRDVSNQARQIRGSVALVGGRAGRRRRRASAKPRRSRAHIATRRNRAPMGGSDHATASRAASGMTGHAWTVKLARVRAREILGQMAGGTNPNSGKNERRDVPTLREGLALHVAEMKDSGKRPRSIETIEYDVPRLLSAYMDRPLSELTVETVQRIKEKNKQYQTQTNRLLAHISAIWNTTRRLRRSQPGRSTRRAELQPRSGTAAHRGRGHARVVAACRASAESDPPRRAAHSVVHGYALGSRGDTGRCYQLERIGRRCSRGQERDV